MQNYMFYNFIILFAETWCTASSFFILTAVRSYSLFCVQVPCSSLASIYLFPQRCGSGVFIPDLGSKCFHPSSQKYDPGSQI